MEFSQCTKSGDSIASEIKEEIKIEECEIIEPIYNLAKSKDDSLKTAFQQKSKFDCLVCRPSAQISFNDYTSFKEHIKIVHKSFQCTHCNFITVCPNILKTHIWVHENKCDVCAGTEYLTFELLAHKVCTKCKKNKSYDELKEILSNKGMVFKCLTCDFTSDSEDLLKTHFLTHQKSITYTQASPLYCLKCDFKTNSTDLLTNHCKVSHSQRVKKCVVCQMEIHEPDTKFLKEQVCFYCRKEKFLYESEKQSDKSDPIQIKPQNKKSNNLVNTDGSSMNVSHTSAETTISDTININNTVSQQQDAISENVFENNRTSTDSVVSSEAAIPNPNPFDSRIDSFIYKDKHIQGQTKKLSCPTCFFTSESEITFLSHLNGDNTYVCHRFCSFFSKDLSLLLTHIADFHKLQLPKEECIFLTRCNFCCYCSISPQVAVNHQKMKHDYTPKNNSLLEKPDNPKKYKSKDGSSKEEEAVQSVFQITKDLYTNDQTVPRKRKTKSTKKSIDVITDNNPSKDSMNDIAYISVSNDLDTSNFKTEEVDEVIELLDDEDVTTLSTKTAVPSSNEEILYECKIGLGCKYKSNILQRFLSHIKIRHSHVVSPIVFSHPCPICKIIVQFPRHMSLVHFQKIANILMCSTCEFTTKSEVALKSHEWDHENNSTCDICKKNEYLTLSYFSFKVCTVCKNSKTDSQLKLLLPDSSSKIKNNSGTIDDDVIILDSDDFKKS